jgi:hypothetical protein
VGYGLVAGLIIIPTAISGFYRIQPRVNRGRIALGSSGGFVTTEFLFAIVIAFGMTLVTFALTFTLSTVEIAQYATFSSSRAHAAGNFDIDSQKKAARMKYSDLLEKSAFSNLFQNGWFSVSKSADIEILSGSDGNFGRDYSSDTRKFEGVRTTFTAKILEMQLPFLGKIQPDDDKGFRARLTGFLIREPSQKECLDYMEARKEKLWDYDGQGRFSKFRKNSTIATPWEDNGC